MLCNKISCCQRSHQLRLSSLLRICDCPSKRKRKKLPSFKVWSILWGWRNVQKPMLGTVSFEDCPAARKKGLQSEWSCLSILHWFFWMSPQLAWTQPPLSTWWSSSTDWLIQGGLWSQQFINRHQRSSWSSIWLCWCSTDTSSTTTGQPTVCDISVTWACQFQFTLTPWTTTWNWWTSKEFLCEKLMKGRKSWMKKWQDSSTRESIILFKALKTRTNLLKLPSPVKSWKKATSRPGAVKWV